MKNIYLICPVRNISDEVKKKLDEYVCGLEYNEEVKVHYPPRDVDQNDPIGYTICLNHSIAMSCADEVHIWYDPNSIGSIFDLGMTFYKSIICCPSLKVVLINPDNCSKTPHKSFQNIIRVLSKINN